MGERTDRRLCLPCAYGKYELLEHIGSGGMSEIYRARLSGLAGFEKNLVIKRLLPHLMEQPDFVQMFVEEAKLAARIEHKNVVQLFDFGQVDNGELYIAMEHVPGIDLRALLRASVDKKLRLPVWFGIHVVSEVLSGLCFVHDLTDEEGRPLLVVHRDLSPSNIFLSNFGDVKIGDFGIARSSYYASFSAQGEVRGKVSYMSPEQVLDRPLDHRSDLFAVGTVLWECLTQRRLFGGRGSSEATAEAIKREPRVPPSSFNVQVPVELDTCVLHALEIDPDRRVRSAEEFQRCLLTILSRIHPRVLPSEIRDVIRFVLGRRSLPPPPPDASEWSGPTLSRSLISAGAFDTDARGVLQQISPRPRETLPAPSPAPLIEDISRTFRTRSQLDMPAVLVPPPIPTAPRPATEDTSSDDIVIDEKT